MTCFNGARHFCIAFLSNIVYDVSHFIEIQIALLTMYLLVSLTGCPFPFQAGCGMGTNGWRCRLYSAWNEGVRGY